MPNLLPDALDLPKPTLVEADVNGRVDSLTLLDGGNVSVCYDDMQATDRITLNWPLAGSPYPPIPPQNGHTFSIWSRNNGYLNVSIDTRDARGASTCFF